MKGRHELKHEMSKADCYLLKQKLQHIMSPDPHAGPDGKYVIRSIYFDNFTNKVLTEKKEGYFNRCKFRVRLYNNNFAYMNVEKKTKVNNMTFKEKCSLTPEEYEKIRLGDIEWLQNDERKLLNELHLHMTLYQLKPVTIIDYTREVFIKEEGNVRVTFDSDVKTSFHNTDLLNLHTPMIDVLDYGTVIVEVKYDGYLPDVIKKLLQISDRRSSAFSKYQLGRMFG
ncbi:VTC domain-containing protein [Psychrobacillus glaciei]|uniref:VTC domain-containing protein n=1 Tax=Psychrobacillus glaciei TaxID=2283160 RepID=A0A5J6ST85_9BACI|nr:polyphosphate polymerase domain-containing protein [Psychrobacillus glaciei]QFG00653.1 VTC domain-containing protein [Psychrobacillus glaciei]